MKLSHYFRAQTEAERGVQGGHEQPVVWAGQASSAKGSCLHADRSPTESFIFIASTVIKCVFAPALRFFPGIVAAVISALVLSSCGTVPAHSIPLVRGPRDVMKEVMACSNKLVLISEREFQRGQPVLVLLHGATDDPSEMLAIAQEHLGTHNVFLYSYNFHLPIDRVAWDFVREMRLLQAAQPEFFMARTPAREFTVVSYSYSAIVFRKAVLLAGEEGLFSNATIVQMVPTAGGSFRARYMGNPITAILVALASKFSAAENPYGGLAEELWDGEGNRKFYEAIDAYKMRTLLVEDDPHSLAKSADEVVRRRYRNGIGVNVVTIPKRSGVTHENFPTHPVALSYLRTILEPAAKERADARTLRPALAEILGAREP